MGEKPVVAFLGPSASYTHQATISEFPESRYDIRPQTDIKDVFAAVQTGAAAHGVVPFENSTNGSVIFTLDLLADLNNLNPDILVTGEIYLKVQHCLLGRIHAATRKESAESRRTNSPWRPLKAEESSQNISGTITPTRASPTPAKPRVAPSYDLKHVQKLYSHPQAWGQCKLFLNAYLKGIERQDVSSTSRAAEIVAADDTGTSAAISSRIAAEVHGLDILAEGIEDAAGNSTRFFILRRRDSSGLHAVPAPVVEAREMQEYKSLVTLTVSHDSPGALADSLAVFKKHGLNLTNLTSRPSGEAAWHYIFFVEFKGRKREGADAGGAVNVALKELDGVAESWRCLGSWENKLKAT